MGELMVGRVSAGGGGVAAGAVGRAVGTGRRVGAGMRFGDEEKTWGFPSGPRWIRILVPSFSYSNSVRLFFLMRSMTALISLISI
jgi:hypothetical protein